jgi:hypothetical protein
MHPQGADLISRMTIFSLLLSLMLGLGIKMLTDGRHDACDAYLDGNPLAQSSEYVPSGTRMIAVPCDDWLMRQPLVVQMLCLLELCLALACLLNALADLRDWLNARKRSD